MKVSLPFNANSIMRRFCCIRANILSRSQFNFDKESNSVMMSLLECGLCLEGSLTLRLVAFGGDLALRLMAFVFRLVPRRSL